VTARTLAVGALSLTVTPPAADALDAALLAATGCSAVEIDTILAAGPGRAASALLPFLTGDVPDRDTLAQAIAGDPDARAAIRALYPVPVVDAPAHPEAE
jgi:hypothetical protein